MKVYYLIIKKQEVVACRSNLVSIEMFRSSKKEAQLPSLKFQSSKAYSLAFGHDSLTAMTDRARIDLCNLGCTCGILSTCCTSFQFRSAEVALQVHYCRAFCFDASWLYLIRHV